MAIYKAPVSVQRAQTQRPQVSSLSVQSLLDQIGHLAKEYGVDPTVLLAVVTHFIQTGGASGLQGLGDELIAELGGLLKKLASGDNPGGETTRQLIELFADVLNQLGQRHAGNFLKAAGEMAGGAGDADGEQGRRFQDALLKLLQSLGLPADHLTKAVSGKKGLKPVEDTFQVLALAPLVVLQPKLPGAPGDYPGAKDHEVSVVRRFVRELAP